MQAEVGKVPNYVNIAFYLWLVKGRANNFEQPCIGKKARFWISICWKTRKKAVIFFCNSKGCQYSKPPITEYRKATRRHAYRLLHIAVTRDSSCLVVLLLNFAKLVYFHCRYCFFLEGLYILDRSQVGGWWAGWGALLPKLLTRFISDYSIVDYSCVTCLKIQYL